MYLVHARFETVLPSQVPWDIKELSRSLLLPADHVEHLSVHRRSARHFVLGFYLLAGSLAEAETRAERVSLRLLGTGALPPARLLAAEAPLMVPEAVLGFGAP
ncbi:hypothetical protein ABT354_11675 [Streptomyces sp. NPDC000594]|uniref:hypothetical protein n=1 Tax=Streptomyces sp. NPDC000594 TaxID=3154261 RepID=UPI00331DE238